ncbi:hypothetical protein GQ55_7G197300 [Panicum hallii var. hallii]|uniref:Uncharacterized protein n=1 Tax=Panicum hallii var. hallii TaxID=1504633 RepID=A0A2T7CWU7_9POAL|nr:hypothetical protein GQ55_7G197300 [Panicum hallii var. hallii]
MFRAPPPTWRTVMVLAPTVTEQDRPRTPPSPPHPASIPSIPPALLQHHGASGLRGCGRRGRTPPACLRQAGPHHRYSLASAHLLSLRTLSSSFACRLRHGCSGLVGSSHSTGTASRAETVGWGFELPAGTKGAGGEGPEDKGDNDR